MDEIWRERNAAQHSPKERREINTHIQEAYEKKSLLGLDQGPHEISTFQMVQSALKSIHEKSQTQTLKSPHWLLSSAAARSYPVPRPGRYGRYGYPGSYPDTDTSREDVEVALPRRIWYECNFNYQVGAVE